MAADPRFHPAAGPLPLSDLARAAGATLPADVGDLLFGSVATLAGAGPGEVSFLDGKRWLPALRSTKAGAVIVAPEFAAEVPAGAIALVVGEPVLGFARVAALLHPPPRPNGVRHPTASVAEDAVVGEGCEIGPYAVIEAGARLGPRCIVAAHAHVGPGCVFGADCRILSHVTVSHTVAGDRVTLNPGARVGSEGFGFASTSRGEHVTVPQLGIVRLGDDVEIGANACVDRGSGNDTELGAGTRLDNLVMLGHNVRTGRGCVVVAQAGIAGSTVLGDHVVLAAQAGLTGHVTIGDRARIGAQAGVMNNVPAGTDVVGSPAWPVRETLRAFAVLRKLAAPRPATTGEAGGAT